MGIIKTKVVSYGTIQIRDAGAISPRYSILVNGEVKEYSDDLKTIEDIYDRKYY